LTEKQSKGFELSLRKTDKVRGRVGRSGPSRGEHGREEVGGTLFRIRGGDEISLERLVRDVVVGVGWWRRLNGAKPRENV
jgi:hypothetical protein